MNLWLPQRVAVFLITCMTVSFSRILLHIVTIKVTTDNTIFIGFSYFMAVCDYNFAVYCCSGHAVVLKLIKMHLLLVCKLLRHQYNSKKWSEWVIPGNDP
jgi:hypothetical protein